MTHIGPQGKDAVRPIHAPREPSAGRSAPRGDIRQLTTSNSSAHGRSPCNLVIYLPDLSGGGAERLHVRLAPKFIEAGHRVTFLLDRRAGELLSQLPDGCEVHTLGASRQLRALPKLVRYLRRIRPDLLIANMEHMNVMAILARHLAGVPTGIVVTQHSTLSDQVKRGGWKFRSLPALYRLTLPFADKVVTVSAGVADELAHMAGLSRASLAVIHNGVVTDDIDRRLAHIPAHPWFNEAPPIILGMGRLVAQKDFATLIRAFAQIADRTSARLVILGEGPLRAQLEAEIRSLGRIANRISLPGFVQEPLPLIARAKLFVLSSRSEGFANVLAEALACGTPVVSTDCPYGPAEILENGRHGRLVPVGDAGTMADAMLASLAEAPGREALMRRGRSFSIGRCADAYLDLIDDALPASSHARLSR